MRVAYEPDEHGREVTREGWRRIGTAIAGDDALGVYVDPDETDRWLRLVHFDYQGPNTIEFPESMLPALKLMAEALAGRQDQP